MQQQQHFAPFQGFTIGLKPAAVALFCFTCVALFGCNALFGCLNAFPVFDYTLQNVYHPRFGVLRLTINQPNFSIKPQRSIIPYRSLLHARGAENGIKSRRKKIIYYGN